MKKLQVIQPVVFHLHNIMDTVLLLRESFSFKHNIGKL